MRSLIILLLLFAVSCTTQNEEKKRTPEPMKYVKVPYISGNIIVDGSLTDTAWGTSPRIALERFPWEAHRETAIREETAVRILRNDTHLFFAFLIEDADMHATEKIRDGEIFKDERIAIYIAPNGPTKKYFCFEINHLGTLLDYSAKQKLTYNPSWNAKNIRIASMIDGTINTSNNRDIGVVIEIAIPLEDLTNQSPFVGEIWGLAIHRINHTLVANAKTRAHSTWRFSSSIKPDFHIPDAFGILEFAQ